MAIAREDLHIGGRCLLRTRLNAPGGAAVSYKTRPVVVREVLRSAIVAQLDDGSKRTIPFTELEADREYLAERAQKQERKKAAMRSDALRVVEPLKFNLGDKLMHEDDDAPEPVSDAVRDEAKRQIDALKTAPEGGMNALERERRAAVALFKEAMAQGASRSAAAEQVGHPASTLLSWASMIERGLPLGRKMGKQKGAKNTPREVREKALAMARAGRSLVDIARELGISAPSMVGRWRQRADEIEGRANALDAPAAPTPPVPVAPNTPMPAPAVEDERDRELRELRAENARLQAKVKRLLSMVEDL